MSNRTKKMFGDVVVEGGVHANLDGKFYWWAEHASAALRPVGDGLNRNTHIHASHNRGTTDSAALAKVQVEHEIERLGALINKRYEEHEMACAADAARVRLANSLWPDEVTT